MTPTRQGSFHLFRFGGINVYLHWSWFAVAALELSQRAASYSAFTWNVLEYLSLFLIVLMHEFGHAFACRQVGGKADQIVLWPLGGVAYVSPPPRPGAMLWSIAAGPLVNVLLLGVLSILVLVSQSLGWKEIAPNASGFLVTIWVVNVVLLVFNLLPIYPLDGGQILRSLLWFVVGRSRSLMIASMTGFGGVALLVAFAVWNQSIWIGIMSGFILLNCWGGLMEARALARADQAPRHDGFACPVCRRPPPRGAFWVCGHCRKPFDMFEARGVCPNCGAQFSVARCLECGGSGAMNEWAGPPPIPGDALNRG